MLLIFVRMNVQTRRAMIVYISFMRWFLQHPFQATGSRSQCLIAFLQRLSSRQHATCLLVRVQRYYFSSAVKLIFVGRTKAVIFGLLFLLFSVTLNTFIRLLFIWYKKTAHLSPSFIAKSITFKYINDSVCTETSFCLAQ